MFTVDETICIAMARGDFFVQPYQFEPESDPEGEAPEEVHTLRLQQDVSEGQRLVARKRDGKERNKLKRQIEKVEKERKKEKYKKSCQGLRKQSDSPQSKWVTEEKEMHKKKEGEKTTVKMTCKKPVEGTQEDLMELFHSYTQTNQLHRCGLGCRLQLRYHCLYCSLTPVRKPDFIKHLDLCKKQHSANRPARATTPLASMSLSTPWHRHPPPQPHHPSQHQPPQVDR